MKKIVSVFKVFSMPYFGISMEILQFQVLQIQKVVVQKVNLIILKKIQIHGNILKTCWKNNVIYICTIIVNQFRFNFLII